MGKGGKGESLEGFSGFLEIAVINFTSQLITMY